MPEATVQGELHVSQRDARALLAHDLSAYDALFVEGRDNRVDLAVSTPGVALFLVGALEAFALQALVNGIVDRLRGGRSARSEVERTVSREAVAVHDDIDVPLSELHGLAPRWVGALAGLLVGGLLAALVVPTPFVTVRGPLTYRLVLVAWTAGAPLVYLLAVLLATDGSREAVMVDRIVTRSGEAGYDRVLVSCGDRHVEGVAAGLRDRGWTVTTGRTGHGLLRRFVP